MITWFVPLELSAPFRGFHSIFEQTRVEINTTLSGHPEQALFCLFGVSIIRPGRSVVMPFPSLPVFRIFDVVDGPDEDRQAGGFRFLNKIGCEEPL